MKTTMKLFAAIIIMLGFTVISFGQGASTGSIAANAEIVSTILVNPTHAIDFGVITPEVAKTISAAGLTSGSSTVGISQGMATITRALGQSIAYKITTTTDNLTLSGGTATIPISAYTSRYKITGGSSFTPGAGGNTATPVASSSGVPTVEVEMGATVTPGTIGVNPAGVYSGTIILSAEYN